MPDLRLRRILLAAGLIGILFACAGVFQLATAQAAGAWNTGRWLLIIAWLILMPLFVSVISLRGRARRGARHRAEARKQEVDAEIARLRTREGIRAIGGGDPPPPPDAGAAS